MDFIESFLIIAISSVAARTVGLFLFKGADRQATKNTDLERVVVKNPPVFITVGILGIAFGVGMGILAKLGILIGSDIAKIFIVFFPILVSLYFIVYGLMFKIIIYKNFDYIIFRSINRIKRKIYYKDIDYYIERKNGNIDFFVKGKKYHVSPFSYNFGYLVQEFGRRCVKKKHADRGRFSVLTKRIQGDNTHGDG